jgi:uroporphyrinogen decarboxylase
VIDSRALIRDIVALRPAPRRGFWLGNPHPDTWPLYHRYFGTRTEEELRLKLGDDFRWITPQYMATTYRHPAGKKIFDSREYKVFHGQPGPLAGAETEADVAAFDWPDPGYLDFSECLAALRGAGPYYRASGFWAPFFHDVMDLFGLEEYFVKMHTNPAVVHAVTARVCGFYLEANRRFFDAADAFSAEQGSTGLVDAYFFGNDFGTQRDLIISPRHFEEFILPWFRRFTDQARSRGCQVILHSCGAIARVIPHLIASGVNCLHPLQARAAGMEAELLARDFRGKIAFLGGIDTQQLLVRGSPADVRAEVRRLKDVFGPWWIVSPSHEALLPNVPPENVAAMAEVAREV